MQALMKHAFDERARFVTNVTINSTSFDLKAIHLRAKMLRERGEAARDEIITAQRDAALNQFIIAAWMRASQFLDLNTVECSTGSPGKVPGDEIFVSHTRHCPFADCSVVIPNKKDTPETLRLDQAGREYQVVSINEVRMRLHSHTHAPTTASLMTRWLTSARRSPIYRHGPQSHAFAFVMPQFNGDFNGDERLRADPIRKTVGRQPSAVCRQQCVVVSDQALR